MSLTDVCIQRPVLAWMLMAATVVFGGVAAGRIGISQYPDVDFPVLTVSVVREGAAPESMETDVVDPLEEALAQVEGLRSMQSTSRLGSASITLELDLARDVGEAMQDVQQRVSGVQHHLPRDIEAPTIAKSNPEDNPIMWIGLSGPYSRQLLADTARYRVKERLQTVPGVGEITAGGAIVRNVRIWVDAQRLDEKDVTVAEVVAALQREHVELPAGRIEAAGRETTVRVLGEALDLETFRGIVVKRGAAGPVRLGEVALVEDGFEDVRRFARANGEPSQGLGVRKQRGANAVAVAEGVRAALEEIRRTLPPDMELAINFDSTEFIEDSVKEIELELVLSVLLTALVCWMFLGSLSSTLNVVLAIPMSLLGTVAFIYFAGFTFNTFTLLALALAVGIVVDDAIMVMENIFRHAEGGKERVRAAREGTREITFAALAATLAVVAIFTPVVFMSGVIGKYFLQFGVTLCVAILLSYVEAMTLAPARTAQLVRMGQQRRTRLGRVVDAAFEGLARGYRRALAVSLRRAGLVLVAAVAVLAASVWGLRAMPSEFVPTQDQSRLMLRLQTAVGSSLDETDAIVRRVEEYLLARPEVVRIFGSVGGMGTGSVNAAMLFVTLVPPDERKATHTELAATLRRDLNAIPGLRAVVMDPSQSGFAAARGFPVEFSVRGPDWEKLVELQARMREELAKSGLVVDLDSDYQVGMPELAVEPDRDRAADLGVPVQSIATTVNALVGGVTTGRFSMQGRRVDVRLRALAAQRASPEDVSRLRVRTAAGETAPLSSVLRMEERPALQAIYRRDRERAITVYANVAPGRSQDEALAQVDRLAKELMPPGYRAVLSGASVAFRESMASLVFALVLGIAVAYMVLASQFNSFLHPVTVLTILPLSVAGAVAALALAGKTLNIFSMIGLLLLMGIVKKNSIILVDYANQARAAGAGLVDAMLQAGPVRLRPILMTSTATLMAALPPALGLGPGAEIRTPMALGVIGGVAVSTLLSLLVVPAFYVVAGRARDRLLGRKWKAIEDGVEPPAATGGGAAG